MPPMATRSRRGTSSSARMLRTSLLGSGAKRERELGGLRVGGRDQDTDALQWRSSEILGLRWTQVDLTAGVIRLEVGTTKNNEGRVLPFHVLPALRDLLIRQRDCTERQERERHVVIPWVFHRRGKRIKSMNGAWSAACRKAACPGRLFHDLRRTAVRNLERAGVPRSIAMKITGHKTEAVYRRYAIVNEADVAEGLEKLGRFLGGKVGSLRKPS